MHIYIGVPQIRLQRKIGNSHETVRMDRGPSLLRFTGLEPGSVLCAFRDSQVPYVEERWPFYDGGGAGYEQKGQAPCLVFPEAGTSSLQLRLSL